MRVIALAAQRRHLPRHPLAALQSLQQSHHLRATGLGALDLRQTRTLPQFLLAQRHSEALSVPEALEILSTMHTAYGVGAAAIVMFGLRTVKTQLSCGNTRSPPTVATASSQNRRTTAHHLVLITGAHRLSNRRIRRRRFAPQPIVYAMLLVWRSQRPSKAPIRPRLEGEAAFRGVPL